MPNYPYRDLKPTAEAEVLFRRWIAHLNEEFKRHEGYERRCDIVRDELFQIYTGKTHGSNRGTTVPLITELASSVLAESLDPRNITLEPEYYGDIDTEKYMPRKPLIWLWQMFDRSPLGLNHWLGFHFRCMLAQHIFKKIGKGVKMFHGIEFSYGYNLTVEDNCTIHKYVMLDDRGEIIIREGSSISDYASIYSHSHDIHQQSDVTHQVTEIGPRARITYHATVLAGAKVGEDSMLGAMALATKPVPAHAISVGIPAKKIHDKG